MHSRACQLHSVHRFLFTALICPWEAWGLQWRACNDSTRTSTECRCLSIDYIQYEKHTSNSKGTRAQPAGTQSFYSLPFKYLKTSILVTTRLSLLICQLHSIFISQHSFISITWTFHFGCLHQFLQFIGPFPHVHCRGSIIHCSLVSSKQSYKPVKQISKRIP